MIYLDHGATSMGKPPQVAAAMTRALRHCANPGRGGYEAAMAAALSAAGMADVPFETLSPDRSISFSC